MNIPNKLTFLRIFLIPVMMFFYLLDSFQFGKIVAALIFIIAIITDLLDGHIARKYNMVTDLGKFLDPIADKLLVTASLLLLITDGTIPAPYGVIALFIILSRDFIVGVLRQMAATKRNVIAADNLGKIKTLFQDISIIFIFIMAYNNVGNLISGLGKIIFNVTGFTLFFVSVVLTIISGMNYIIKNKKLFK
ncbi:MAG: CDP-diacylglycerol--glycerol-3-phosphate 3-phosphatidyltransferase [Clostridia bacterium]|nr:CDP-diacylglycerol--glycerol-3-phosphate 3-phosphatidyltransferase [Clostridia bacterium]